jgi:hypothetical protein
VNPIRWKCEHKLAGIIICLIGSIGGLFFAWMQSPFRVLATNSFSGEWSEDYTGVFLHWVQYAHYWPWPVLGALTAGLAFYAFQLIRQ